MTSTPLTPDEPPPACGLVRARYPFIVACDLPEGHAGDHSGVDHRGRHMTYKTEHAGYWTCTGQRVPPGGKPWE